MSDRQGDLTLPGSGEKGNRCESCTNSSLYLGSACQKLTGQPGRGQCMMICKSGELPDCWYGKQKVSTPRVLAVRMRKFDLFLDHFCKIGQENFYIVI